MTMAKRKESTVQTAERLIAPILSALGLSLWDARFEKEGSDWYLRYLIDRDDNEPVGMKDLEDASKAVSKVLDEADPIPQSYMLEVSSPGAERELTRDRHFAHCMGKTVSVRLIRPVNGARDYIGELAGYNLGIVTILTETGEEISFAKKDAARIRLYVDFETGGYD